MHPSDRIGPQRQRLAHRTPSSLKLPTRATHIPIPPSLLTSPYLNSPESIFQRDISTPLPSEEDEQWLQDTVPLSASDDTIDSPTSFSGTRAGRSSTPTPPLVNTTCLLHSHRKPYNSLSVSLSPPSRHHHNNMHLHNCAYCWDSVPLDLSLPSVVSSSSVPIIRSRERGLSQVDRPTVPALSADKKTGLLAIAKCTNDISATIPGGAAMSPPSVLGGAIPFRRRKCPVALAASPSPSPEYTSDVITMGITRPTTLSQRHKAHSDSDVSRLTSPPP
ncbi:hypothetical protein AX17_004359 [Amanita inopinata Kibby_2008]|nr:hypothetical protein AX17_004359 [Amanita inopinata Kibby_2008]